MQKENTKNEPKSTKVAAQPEGDSPSTTQPDVAADENYPTLPLTPGNPGTEPAPTIDPEAHLEISNDGKTFKGSKSQKRFPIDQKKSVIVRQVKIENYNGGLIEVPNTEQIQTYTPAAYQSLVDSNFFTESNVRTEILHQPAK